MEFEDFDSLDEDYINDLIENKAKENVQLEYKSGEFLKNTPEGKFKLQKWISGFANSAGGLFVIGVKEEEDIEEINGKKIIKDEYPKEIDGIDKRDFTIPIRKWIEDTLTNSIFPHLNPTPLIKTFTWSKDSNREIVIIRVRQTNAVVHYVRYKGKEYYFHRHNFETKEMDEWEVRALLFGRAPPPIFNLDCEAVQYRENIDDNQDITYNGKVNIKLINEGFGIGKNIQIGIISNSEINLYNLRTENIIYNADSESVREVPLNYRTEKNVLFNMLSPSFTEIFDIGWEVYITRIDDNRVLHSGDSESFIFSLKMKLIKTRYHRIGVFIFSENSKAKYFGIEFYLSNMGLECDVIPYSEDNKIKIE